MQSCYGSAESTNATGEAGNQRLKYELRQNERYGFCFAGYKTNNILVQIEINEDCAVIGLLFIQCKKKTVLNTHTFKQ